MDGTYDVSCAGTEIEAEEDNGNGEDGDPDPADINPQSIRFEDVNTKNTIGGGGGNPRTQVELRFRSFVDSDVDIVEARINFYNAERQGQRPTTAEIAANQGGSSATLNIGGGFRVLNPPITLDGAEGSNPLSSVWFEFNANIGNDWFVLTLQFDDDSSRQYFISLRED